MTHPPKECDATQQQSSARVVLRRICKEIDNVEFTGLVRVECLALIYSQDSRGMTITFKMRNEDAMWALVPRLMHAFLILRKLYAAEAGTNLFNLTTTYAK